MQQMMNQYMKISYSCAQGPEIPKLSYDMRNICEGRLSIKECFYCLQSFENNNHLQIMALQLNFTKHFGILLEIYLLILSIIHINVVITLIEKKGKHK